MKSLTLLLRSLIIGYILLVCAILSACSNSTTEYQPAALKQRTSGLYEVEFKKQQQLYNTIVEDIKANPDVSDNYAALAQLFMNEARTTGDHPYYYPAALAALEHALTRDEAHTHAKVLKTSVLLSLHRFAEARTLASQLASGKNASHVVYGMLCDANVELGYYDQAIAAADNMIRLRPGAESYARISYLRELHGDTDGAIDAMRLAVQAGLPGTEDAAWMRITFGNLLLEQGRLLEAQEQFELARLERSDYPFALAGLASVCTAKANITQAIDLLNQAIAMVPEVEFVEQLAEIQQRIGDTIALQKTLATLEVMMDEDEKAGHVNYADRALLYAKFNYKPDVALVNALRDIALRPNNITAQQAMAKALFCNARFDESHVYASKAQRLHKNKSQHL